MLRFPQRENLENYGYRDAWELIERKRAGERTVLDAATSAHWQTRVGRAFQLLDEAHAASELPDDMPNVAELDRWLVDVRLRLVRA